VWSLGGLIRGRRRRKKKQKERRKDNIMKLVVYGVFFLNNFSNLILHLSLVTAKFKLI